MKSILIVFGTRPEAIKMAPVVMEFKKHPDKFRTIVCVTGQHREMLDQVLSLFDIIPDYDLDIMKAGQDLYDVTSRVLLGMRDILIEAKPDMVLVHGDTTTSTAAALAAFYQQIPVGHVEAGLRTNDIYSPWPEEMNRQITGRIATLHFAPTDLSVQNLQKEGVPADRIFKTGNTVIDALNIVLEKIESNANIISEIENDLAKLGLPIELVRSWDGNLSQRRMVLITGHRRENFGDGFINIFKAIRDLAINNQAVDFVYPMHLNPNVRKPISEVFGDLNNKQIANVFFIEPLQYLPFVYLMKKCSIVLTDSGGVQEEAPGLGKPVLVMRNTTERPEAVNAGTVKIVGTDKKMIEENISELLDNYIAYNKMAEAVNPYGDGKACGRIYNCLINLASFKY